MAWSQDSEILAAYALAGGMATPRLLSTGGNHEIFLFTYILALDLATVLLIRLKSWPRLLLGAFPATVAYFIGWYIHFNSPSPARADRSFRYSFLLCVRLCPHWLEVRSDAFAPGEGTQFRITEVFLPLANATFASLALYSLLQDAGHHNLLPWLMVLFAADLSWHHAAAADDVSPRRYTCRLPLCSSRLRFR